MLFIFQILMTLFICWLPIYQLFQIPAVGMDSESYDITGSNTRQHEDTSEVTLGIPVSEAAFLFSQTVNVNQ